MGRPIKKRYFSGGADVVVRAGESVSSVAILTSGTNYSSSATSGVVFSNPDLLGGTLATGYITVNGAGNITNLFIINSGSGYTSDPGIAIVGGTGTGATFNASLLGVSVVNPGKIACTAYLPKGVSSQASAILKQESSRRYLVQNTDGDGICKLTASGSLAAGQMSIVATDSASNSYYVTKLTSRKAQVTPFTTGQFAANALVGWTTGTAIANVSVKITTN
jgi:hypothetical protein